MSVIINLEITEDDVLLPCPFCGLRELELCNTWTPYYWIECANCGAQMHKTDLSLNVNGGLEDHVIGKHAAIDAWNRRMA